MPGLPQPGGQQRAQQKFIVFENFEKMNTQSVRQSLSEKELAWLENIQPISANNLATVPAPAAAALATISGTISEMFYADLSGVDYFVVFTQAGSGYLINIATGAVNHFAPDGTFSPYPDVTTWQASRLLIADPIGGYTTFDGTLYISQGGVSPNIVLTNGGAGYGAAPSVTISGGSGVGATAHSVVENGAVVQVILDNPGVGYQASDVLTVTFGTSPGSGAAGTANMTGSSVTSVTINARGLVYYYQTPGPGVYAGTFTGGGGTGASALITVSQIPGNQAGNGWVTGVTILSGGKGYTSPPTLTFATSLWALQPAFSVFLGTQSVASLTLTNGGSLYTAPPTATIVPPDGIGSGAAAVTTETGGVVQTLTLVPSALVSIAIASQGIYTASPGVYPLIFAGGGGSGATGTATLAVDPSGFTSNVVCTHILLTFGGINYTSSPTVTVNAAVTTQATFLALTASQGSGYDTQANVVIGSGAGAAASAHVWPFITSSIAAYAFTTVAVFQGRVWLGGGSLLTWTGTGASYGDVGYDDFLSADASGALIISDADLIHSITALRSLNNYLFIMGDQSVKQIGNVSLNATGTVTLFTILTLSSDQGTIYKKSCISYNRVFMFANTNGIYGVFGSSVQKLSGDMDGIWRLVDFTQLPQGALADINAIHNAVFLIRYKDPLSVTRSIMLAFDGKKWFVLNQGNSLTAIATSAALATGQNSLYGSSGPDVTQLLAAPTIPVAFKIQTALTHHGNAVQGKRVIRAGLTSQGGSGGSGAGLLVATSMISNIFLTSTDNGVTWTQQTIPITGSFEDIAWNGSVFCTLTENGTTALTSPDGVTWTAHTIPYGNWNSLCWNGTIFCGVSQNATDVITSPDGATWAHNHLPFAISDNIFVVWNGSVFCMVSDGAPPGGAHGTLPVSMTSPDGVTWTAHTMPAGAWQPLAWNGTVFCTMDYGNNVSATSPDGATWTTHGGLPDSAGWLGIAWNGKVFCAVAYNVSYCLTSPDGITWTQRAMPSVGFWHYITWNGTVFCAVTYGSTPSTNFATSPDGVIWTGSTVLSGYWSAVASSYIQQLNVVTMTVDTEAGLGVVRTWEIPTGVSLVGGSNDASNLPISAAGIYMGLTVTGTLANFIMTNLIEEYQESSLWKGA